MDYITTTQLRTKSTELVNSLAKGNAVSLIHRSAIIGEIRPKRQPKPLTKEDVRDLKRLAEKLNLPKLSYEEREKRYRKALQQKYGQDLS